MTNVQLSLFELASAVGSLVLFFGGALWVFAQIIVKQFQAGLDERFEAQDLQREIGAKQLRETIDRHTRQGEQTANDLRQLETAFLRWQADMPKEYVRREDYIRNQAILEAKQDSLFTETKMVQLQLRELLGRLEGRKDA